MSRIGKKEVLLPQGVSVKQSPGVLEVEGPLGSQSLSVPEVISVEVLEGMIKLSVARESKNSKALWGLTRALLANAVEGVSKGFSRKLIIEGIGYRASIEGDVLVLSLGYSHPARLKTPDGIKFSVEKNVITVSGFNKELVGNTSASIRKLRKPEPYKGKGIRFENEVVRRKAGKKAAAIK